MELGSSQAEAPPVVRSTPSGCPFCPRAGATVIQRGVRDFEYGAPGEFQWVRCQGCELIRLDPMPTPELLAIAYPPTYHAFVKPKSQLTQRLNKLSTAAAARRFARLTPNGGSVLEVGCSHGALLGEIGRLGDYKLFGVEYSPSAASEARARGGIQVWVGDFDDAEIPPASMDLVILQHVLEHVYDPLRTLTKIARVLKPGGRIVGELPSFRSWDAMLFGATWGGGHAPRHLWHFTPETLTAALRRAGFTREMLSPALHTGHWALSVQNFVRRNRRDLGGLNAGRASYYPLFLLLTLPINAVQWLLHRTGVMRFLATKGEAT